MAAKIEIKPIKSRNFTESEAYKRLRTNIQFSGKEMKAIAFTSSAPGDGKSEVTMRTAWSLAELGKKVLYLDADLRNSSLLAKNEIHKELRGLAHYLVGDSSIDDIIVHTQNPYLDLITIGAFPPNPSELLSQDGYKQLLAELKNIYDYIIIDTAPAGVVIDGVIACSAADGVILVIAEGTVTDKAAKLTIDGLKQAKCKIIGSILNKCGQKSGGGYGYGYGYGYDYGYGYGYGYGHREHTEGKKLFGKFSVPNIFKRGSKK